LPGSIGSQAPSAMAARGIQLIVLIYPILIECLW
jgi:hypothetical protein